MVGTPSAARSRVRRLCAPYASVLSRCACEMLANPRGAAQTDALKAQRLKNDQSAATERCVRLCRRRSHESFSPNENLRIGGWGDDFNTKYSTCLCIGFGNQRSAFADRRS